MYVFIHMGRHHATLPSTCVKSPLHMHTHIYNNLDASLAPHRGISTVKGELVPHLVRHQSLKAPPTSHTVTLGKEGGGEEGRTNTTVNRQGTADTHGYTYVPLESFVYLDNIKVMFGPWYLMKLGVVKGTS